MVPRPPAWGLPIELLLRILVHEIAFFLELQLSTTRFVFYALVDSVPNAPARVEEVLAENLTQANNRRLYNEKFNNFLATSF